MQRFAFNDAILLTATMLLCFRGSPVESIASWNYSSHDKWGKLVSTMCDGVRQSPIALRYDETVYSPNLYPVSVYQMGEFGPNEKLSVFNNGHTLMIFFPSCHYYMSLNGQENGGYCIQQFHFHWGRDAYSGSEHSLDGRFYPLEMHIVTYNRLLYQNFTEAAERANGLAVVALFFEERNDIPEQETQLYKMSAFLRSTKAVQAANSTTQLAPFPVEAILDVGEDRGHFYRYDGSLTTPPCTENVVWTLMKKILPVTRQQMEVFRMLRFGSAEAERRMMDNFRKLQSVNPAKLLVPRVIFRSWNSAQRLHPIVQTIAISLSILFVVGIH